MFIDLRVNQSKPIVRDSSDSRGQREPKSIRATLRRSDPFSG